MANERKDESQGESIRKGKLTAVDFLEAAKKLETLAGRMYSIAGRISAVADEKGGYIVMDGIKKADLGMDQIDQFIKKAKAKVTGDTDDE